MNTNLPTPSLSVQYLRNLNTRLKLIFTFLDTVTKRHTGTTAPTTGKWAQSNIVYNSTPSELGSASSKYVITGWICVTSGEPGTWVEMRSLTGN